MTLNTDMRVQLVPSFGSICAPKVERVVDNELTRDFEVEIAHKFETTKHVDDIGIAKTIAQLAKRTLKVGLIVEWGARYALLGYRAYEIQAKLRTKRRGQVKFYILYEDLSKHDGVTYSRGTP